MIPLVVKVTVVFLAGLVAVALCRRLAASHRHLVLLSTILAALLLPVAMLGVPRWDASVLPARELPHATVPPFSIVPPASAPAGPAMPTAGAPPMAGPRTTSLSDAARAPISWLAVWLAGSLLVALWLVAGRLRLAALTRQAWAADDAWRALLESERLRAGLDRNVELFISPAATTPLTWGERAPVILLPEDALAWDDAHRRVVIRHELAHVARHDAMAQLVAGVACTLYWFHPLAWIAARRLRAECERACDDRVLSSGTSPHAYASHLLQVARSARSLGGPGFLSVAMARPSQLEGRLLAVLDETRPRASHSRRARIATVAGAVTLTVILSAFHPVARSPLVSDATVTIPPAVIVADLAAPTRLATVASAAASPLATIAPTRAATDTMLEHSVAVRPGGRLTIRLMPTGGAVTITGWDEPRVHVRTRLGGRDGLDTRVSLTAVAGGAELRATYEGGGNNTSFNNTFEIRVPRRFDIRISSAGGSIKVRDIEGTLTGTTGGGEIIISDTRGTASLSTGGGDVRVSNSTLDGTVSTGGGVVEIRDVTGGLSGSSGTGDVRYYDRDAQRTSDDREDLSTTLQSRGTTTFVTHDDPEAARDFGRSGIQRHSSGGDILLGDAPNGARVSTGGGDIRIGSSAGEVYASTGGGRIDIGPASGSVIASTGAGNISVTFRGGGAHSADLTTGLGTITLHIPANISATLILETAYTNNFGRTTRIQSDFELTTTETSEWDSSRGTPRRYVRSRLVLGSGAGVIRVRAVNGNVVVRRAGGE